MQQREFSSLCQPLAYQTGSLAIQPVGTRHTKAQFFLFFCWGDVLCPHVLDSSTRARLGALCRCRLCITLCTFRPLMLSSWFLHLRAFERAKTAFDRSFCPAVGLFPTTDGETFDRCIRLILSRVPFYTSRSPIHTLFCYGNMTQNSQVPHSSSPAEQENTWPKDMNRTVDVESCCTLFSICFSFGAVVITSA